MTLAATAFSSGCATNHPIERVESPVNVTHEVAFGDFRRVFNTTYHILNRYGVVQTSSYRYGEIRALVGEDTSLFQKTRREIEARIVDTGDYWDVQCRVLIKIEDSEPATFQDQFNPLYEWRTVASDPRLEVRLNNEIRAALSGGAWKAKAPLSPEPRVPYQSKKPHKKARSKSKKSKSASPSTRPSSSPDTDEVSHSAETLASAKTTSSAFERLGILRLRRGAYAEAGKAFRAAISAVDGHTRAHFLLAQAELGQGHLSAALAEFRTGLKANPAWVDSDLNLRDLYDDAKVLDAQIERVVLAVDKDTQLNLLLGYLRYASGDAEGALVAFDRYLSGSSQASDLEVARAFRQRARLRVDAAHGLENF
jgi:tetratricopeptide (TPR) repeat protein